MFRVQNIKTGAWLMEPYKDPNGSWVFPFNQDEREAHEFATRKQANDTILLQQGNRLENFKIVNRKGV